MKIHYAMCLSKARHAALLRPRVRRGVALVEMGMVSVLFLLMVLGIMEFGWMFTVYQAMSNAVREGARYASVQRAGVKNLPEKVRARVQERIRSVGQQELVDAIQNVTVDPPSLQGSQPDTRITVKMTLRYKSFTGLDWFKYVNTSGDDDLHAACAMRWEG